MSFLAGYKSRVRNRVAASLLLAIFPAIILIIAMVEGIIAPNVKGQIQAELTQTTEFLASSIQASASIAIRGHLKSIAERNRDYATLLFSEVDTGLRSRKEALDLLYTHFHSQRIGRTGYLFCVTSAKILTIHPSPEMEGKIVPDDRIAIQQLAMKEGYMEYEWQNPGEPAPRAKALYSVYFAPLDWHITVTAYRSEFTGLLNPEDFRPAINALRFGENGYAYIFSVLGDVVLHPQFKSFNILRQNRIQNDFVKDMITRSQGMIEYEWVDQPEGKTRTKIGAFQRLQDLDWIVASAAYTEEAYAPIRHLRTVLYSGCGFLVLLAGVIAYYLSRRITRPLERMVATLERNNLQNRNDPLPVAEADEIGKLAEGFNSYLTILSQRDEALRDERQRLKDITDNSPGIFYQFRIGEAHSPEVLYLSERFRELTGEEGTKAEFLSHFLLHLLNEDQATFRESLDKAIHNQARWQFEGHFMRPDGTLIWLSAVASPQERSCGLVYNGFFVDITERKRLEEQVHHIQKMDAVGQLAGGIAHDFNNMLGGIMGAAEILQLQASDNKEILRSVKLILDTTDRAAELTSRLLAFSRKDKLENTYVDVAKAVRETIVLLEHTLDKRIKIQFDQQTDQTTVLGDFSQLQNAFLNLGINAGHAMPDSGTLTFSIRQVVLDQQYCECSRFALVPGNYVQIEVRDNGCGIAPEHLERVFEPFFTTRAQGEGTGLGLSAVYGAVQQHHGAITVYSELNAGTVFHIMLPAIHADLATEEAEPDPIPGSGTILVIEDEETLRTTAQALLESLGYRVLLAENGVAGITQYEQNAGIIDLVLLDMVMPQMNGRECFLRIRAINPQAKVILASGFSQEADVLQLKQNGLVGFIRKPYRKWQLSKMIAEALHLPA